MNLVLVETSCYLSFLFIQELSRYQREQGTAWEFLGMSSMQSFYSIDKLAARSFNAHLGLPYEMSHFC
ncbi:hypothetical protein Peur_032428 [Populus x canadensis]